MEEICMSGSMSGERKRSVAAWPKQPRLSSTLPEANIEGLGMRRSMLLELSGMELHEIAHVHRYFVGKLAHSIRHAVVTPLPGQLGHGREMLDDVFRRLRLPKAFAPRREGDVAISDGPAERLREDARIVVQIGRFRPRQIVDLSDMRCGVVKDHRYHACHV